MRLPTRAMIAWCPTMERSGFGGSGGRKLDPVFEESLAVLVGEESVADTGDKGKAVPVAGPEEEDLKEDKDEMEDGDEEEDEDWEVKALLELEVELGEEIKIAVAEGGGVVWIITGFVVAVGELAEMTVMIWGGAAIDSKHLARGGMRKRVDVHVWSFTRFALKF